MILMIVVTQNSTYNVPGISDRLLQQLCRPEFDNTRSAVSTQLNTLYGRLIVILSVYSLWKWRRFRCCAGIVTACIIAWSQEQVSACKSDGGANCMVRSYNNADLCYASHERIVYNDVTDLIVWSEQKSNFRRFFLYISGVALIAKFCVNIAFSGAVRIGHIAAASPYA